ncbi:MAG: glycosyltransferase [Candidatus Kapabacteria bacterium]|nr:glycosyltransferase [Ignavibacteriota bacterium]MCW5884914.1 glycosyltransferase [Candidatus Kapabacteria bacterium]
MLNVLYISHFPDLKMGGQQSMLALIKNLDRSRITPFAILPSEGELKDVLTALDCKCFIVPLLPLKPKHIFQQIKNIISIRNIIKQNNIHIVHPDHERDSLIGGLAKKLTKAKMIWHVRLTRKVKTDNLSVKFSDGIIGISNDVKYRFENFKEIDRKYHTIYNGVECDTFVPLHDKNQIRSELNLPGNCFLINFTGQFKIGKGIYDIIEAAKILKSSSTNIDFKFLLIGTPSSDDFYREMIDKINEYDLKNNFIILSQQSNIHRYMQASDLLLLPSHEGTEGMGRVLFEAMACATPVIATNVKGVREAVTSQTGILVGEKNPKELASAIIQFMNDSDLLKSFGEAGRRRALEVFDIKIHAQNVMKYYFFIFGFGH